jgi:rhomboid protease GluP
MQNDPEQRRRHPLEERPPVPTGTPGSPPQRQQVMLHLPSVTPKMMYAILAVNITIFLIRALSPNLDDQIFSWGANGTREVLFDHEYYRLFTSMFLHAGIFNGRGGYALVNSLHLIFNAYVIYQVGTMVERIFGHVRFGLIYILGGLAGSVMSTVMNGLMGNFNTYSVGASGAAFALIGAQFAFLYHHRKLLGASGRAQMRSLIMFSLINLLFGVASGLGASQIRVDNWAHAGGLAGGLILSWFLSPIFVLERHPERPGALLGQDINPLKRRYWVLSLFVAGLIALLIVGVSVAR